MDRINPKTCLVLVVDVQEKLAAAMPEPTMGRLVDNAVVLLEAARVLGVPVVATEQYPKGLGVTIAPVSDKLREMGAIPIDKMTFDACAEPRVVSAIAAQSPRSIVLVGMEVHVCVFQTARELGRRGYAVHVVADAVASRREENRVLGLGLCERTGAFSTPTETIVFDWLGRAGTPEFKAVSKLVK